MLGYFLILFSLKFVLPEGNVLRPLASLPQSSNVKSQHKEIRQPVPLFLLSDYYSFNVTITHLSPRSIEISWSCKDASANDRYEVTIKPVLASYKVVETVPSNLCFLLMDKLEPNTDYQVAVTAISGRNRKRSRYVVFRTFMEDDYTQFAEDDGDPTVYNGGGKPAPDEGTTTENDKGRLRLPRVRLVEISLVGMALLLWACAIVLFFHRWGKIRMLLPYQPDYKEMKNTASTCTTCSLTPHHQCQKLPHLQNPTADCYPAQGMTITATYHHPQQHPPISPRIHTPHLPHQPNSEPGIGTSTNLIDARSNTITTMESGCSPIRSKMLFPDKSNMAMDMSLHRHHLNNIQRKTRSAEHLKHYVHPCPWEEQSELECTEF